jgi:predicted SAM-dependent methyltransferase
VKIESAIRALRSTAGHARNIYRSYRRHKRLRRERDAAYAAYSVRSPQCLHIGAERFSIPNWFNTDLDPVREDTYYLDATKPFPFHWDAFDFIFSEHMIEHLSFRQGIDMLRECRRVLKPGGVIRIATPNLLNILALLDESHHQDYLQWALKEFNLPGDPYPKAPNVINNFFRSWGHQFIYDPGTLRVALEQEGFTNVVECEVSESSHAPLRGLERHGVRWNDFINRFETMVFEATKPPKVAQQGGQQEELAVPMGYGVRHS